MEGLNVIYYSLLEQIEETLGDGVTALIEDELNELECYCSYLNDTIGKLEFEIYCLKNNERGF